MPELMLTKSFGALKPADPIAEDYLRGLAVGEVVKVKITKPRNGKFHNKVMSLINLAFDNQDQFDDFDDFRKACTIEAGFYRDRRMFDGSHIREAESLSFASMDELSFNRFFNAVFKVISDFLGTDNATLAREVQQYMTVGAG